MSLKNTYDDVVSTLDIDKSKFLDLIEEHIDFDSFIPYEFHMSFNRRFGRPRSYCLDSFIRFFVFQKILGIQSDSLLINLLHMCPEIKRFCGFTKIPDASLLSRFRHSFADHLKLVFDKLVETTEPICREMDPKKSDYLIYDTTGIEPFVNENNPKFINSKLNQAKKLAKSNPAINHHALVYSLMPDTAGADPTAKQQYINGHFCYAYKAGVLTNGLGIVRDIAFFDEGFRLRHPDVVAKKTDNPLLDKEIGDSVSLSPVLYDFFNVHKSFSYKTFIADTAFDKYDTYTMLRDEFGFERMSIPLNPRNSGSKPIGFDSNGTPVCPVDGTPFKYLGASKGANRSLRFKWVCHLSKTIPGFSGRHCFCLNRCTDSLYGRCVYTYPDKNLRFYPGLPRGTTHWDNLYCHRVLIERTINSLKDPLGTSSRKSHSPRTAKADLLFAGITHLICVLLAHAIHKPHLFKSPRKLIA